MFTSAFHSVKRSFEVEMTGLMSHQKLKKPLKKDYRWTDKRLRSWKTNRPNGGFSVVGNSSVGKSRCQGLPQATSAAGGKRSAAVLYSISDAADYNPTPTEKTNRKFWVWKKNAWKTTAETKNFCKKSLYLILKAYNEQIKNAGNRFLTTKIGFFCGKKCGLPCWQSVTPFDRLFL